LAFCHINCDPIPPASSSARTLCRSSLWRFPSERKLPRRCCAQLPARCATPSECSKRPWDAPG
jgi:hypothetical protein